MTFARRNSDDPGIEEQDPLRVVGDTVATHCRICEALCGILVETDGDQVVAVRGDPSDPVSAGYTCPKGRSLGLLHHDPRRYDAPLLRRNDDLTPVSWEALIGDLDGALRAIIDDHGPDAVGIYSATAAAFDANGKRAAERWHRLIGSKSKYSSGSIDTPCKPMVAEMMTGFAGSVPAIDRENPGLVLLVGINPVVSHGHLNAFPNPVVAIRDLTELGEVWVLDPRTSETAQLATRHIAPRAGTDWAVFAYLVRELLIEGADHPYLAEHADGLSRLAEAVAPYDLTTVGTFADVAPADLVDLLEAIRRHGRVAVQTGTGVTMSAAANLTEWLTWALQIVTHSFDVPGGSWFHPGFLRSLDERRFSPGVGGAEPGPDSRPELPRRLGEYPVSAMLDEIESGNLKALFVLGGNPITAFPEADRTRKAMEQLDVLVVADIFTNQMTRYASHVFACTDQLERSDLPHFIDQFLPIVMTKHARAVVAPKADRKPMWWPFAALGERWGLNVLGDDLTADSATDDDLLRKIGDRSRSDYETIKNQRVVIHTPSQIFGWLHAQVLPEGKWRIAPEPLVEQLAEMSTDPTGLVLIPHRQMRHLNSVFIPTGRTDSAGILIHPQDASTSGIEHGDAVLVRSASGAVEGRASITESIRPGAISLPHGFSETNVGALTSTTVGVDALTGMVLQSGLPVSVERLGDDGD